MSRYALRVVGVYNNDEGDLVLPNTPAWGDYVRWLAAGNEPDNPPPPIAPDPPSAEEAAARAELAARATIRAALKANANIQALRGMSPSDVDNWIQTNVTDLASAKSVLRLLAYVVALIARERFG